MKNILIALAVLPILAIPALADMNAEIDMAKTEANKALAADDLELVKMHLHRGVNCLINADNGSWWPKDGTPCDGMGEGAIADSALTMQKNWLHDAFMNMEQGLAEGAIADSKKHVKDAIKILDKAKAAKE